MANKDEVLFTFTAKGDLGEKIDKMNKSLQTFSRTIRRTIRNLEKLQELTRNSTKVITQFNRAGRRLNRTLRQVNVSEARLNRTQNRLNQTTERGTRATQRNTQATRRQAAGFGQGQDAMKAFKAVAAATAVVMALKLAKSAIAVAAEFEILQTKFEPILGSLDAAKERIEELAQFAASTPFQLRGISKASITLETLTDGALSTGAGLRLVGDAAAQAGQPIELLAVHVGRAFSALRANRAVGESLIRFQELGLLSGEARNQIEALQKAGEGKKAFEVLRGELQKTSGGMEKLADTLSGKISTIEDNFALLGNALLKSSGGFDLLKSSADGLLVVLEDINTTITEYDFGAVFEAINPIRKLTNAIAGTSAESRKIEKEKALGTALKFIATEADKLKDTFENVADAEANLEAVREGGGVKAIARANEQLQRQLDLSLQIENRIIAVGKKASEIGGAKVRKEAVATLELKGLGGLGRGIDPTIQFQEDKAAAKRRGREETERLLKLKAEEEARVQLAKARKEAAESLLSSLSENLLNERQLLEKHQNEKFDLLASTGASKGDLAIAEEAFKKESTALNFKLGENRRKTLEAQETKAEDERLALETRGLVILEADKTELQRLQEKFALEQELFKDNATVLAALERDFQEETAKIKESAAAKESAINSARFQSAAMLFGGLASLTKAFQKDQSENSKLFKAFALTQATINMGMAAQQVLANPLLVDPFSKSAAVAAVLATGIANITTIVRARDGLDLGLINGRNNLSGGLLTNDGGGGQEARVIGGIFAAEPTNRFGPGQIAAENNRNTSTRTITQSINFSSNITVASEGQESAVIDALRANKSEFVDAINDAMAEVN